MTEQQIYRAALRQGLKVDKRITTGSSATASHFATFELSGPHSRVEAAWIAIHQGDSPPPRGMAHLRRVDVEDHPDVGQLYIAIESVWCEPELLV